MGKLKNSIKSAGVFIPLYVWMQQSVAAGLPDVAGPSNGKGKDGNYVEMLQGYFLDFAIFAGPAICTISFLAVAKNVIGTYSEIKDGRKEWSDLAMHGGVGCVLLVMVIFLVDQSKDILA